MELVWNWHITESCNYKCHYCFAKWDGVSKKELWKDMKATKKIITDLYGYSIREYPNSKARINFAGGEPLLLGAHLKEYIEYSKSLGFSTSLITNGSFILDNIEIVDCLDMIGISIDSFDEHTNSRIGRCSQGKSLSFSDLSELIQKIKERNSTIKIKFNTVVNKFNMGEEILHKLDQLSPDKVKVFQQLPFKNEEGITSNQFEGFLNGQEKIDSSVFVEDNSAMTQSYLMINPQGEFFSNGNSKGYKLSDPIQDVGVMSAATQIDFNIDTYNTRYGN